MEKFMTIDQVAEALVVHRSTVYRLINSGKLVAINVNSSVRISEDSYQNFVKQNVRGVKTSKPDSQSKKSATAEDLLKFSGTWKGPKEEISEIIRFIEESRTEAEF